MAKLQNLTQSLTPSETFKARYFIHQPYARNYGKAIQALANIAHKPLMEWQKACIETISAIDDEGQFIHRTVAASIPRQAGKSTLIEMYAIFLAMVIGARVLWTAHNYTTTMKTIEDFRDIIGARPNDLTRGIQYFNQRMARASSKTAQEYFMFKKLDGEGVGGSIVFSTRTKTATLGNTFDIIILDEAQEVTGEHLQALLPTASSGKLHNPQFVYVGTPRRAGSLADKFENIRSAALSETPPQDMCYIEFGLDEVGDVEDETRWYVANPSLAAGVANINAIRAMLPQMGSVAFAQECLGVWLSPLELAGGVGVPVIDLESWEQCSTTFAPTQDVSAFAVKFSVDGAVFSICAAIRCGATTHIELVDRRSAAMGKQALIEFISSRGQRTPFVIDGKSGASALIERINMSVPHYNIIQPRADDLVSANTTLKDAVAEQTITWYKPQNLDDTKDALTVGVTESFKRRIGTQGGWGFDGQYADIAEAAALALWQANRNTGYGEMEVFFG